MCAPSPAAGSALGDILSSPVAVLATLVGGSGAVLAAWAGGSTLLAWTVVGLAGWAAIATITLLAVLARPVPPVASAPRPAPPQRASAVILARAAEPVAIEAARPALEGAAPARRRVRWSS